jgi:hypothetical protein
MYHSFLYIYLIYKAMNRASLLTIIVLSLWVCPFILDLPSEVNVLLHSQITY